MKKLYKALGIPEQSKIFSGFGFGIITSILLITVYFLSHPLKTSFLYPVFQGFNGAKSPLVSWPFSSFNNFNKTHEGVVEELSKNSSLIDSSGGKLVPEKPQTGNFSVSVNNASSSSDELSKDPTLIDSSGEKSISEKPQSGNFSGSLNNVSSSRDVARVDEKPLQGNLSCAPVEKSKNGSSVANSVGTGDGNVGSNGTSGSVSSTKQEEPDLGSFSDFRKCDIFDGRWVRDEGKPLYPLGSCPYVDKEEDCHLNKRPDREYLKWRWQPKHCNIPSLNATDFLERLRGKRLVFVGDSLNRNMWESLVCILRHSVANKKKVYEISGKTAFKKKGIYAFHYEDFNCSIDFVASPFLVRETSVNSGKELTETLRLDLMDQTSSKYHDADIIVFNTGHWWTHEKTSKGENYYQEGNHVYPILPVIDAYTKALSTWARWIDKNVDSRRSQVLFRGYSVTHFHGGQWNSGGQCHEETEPIYNDTYLAKYPSKMKAVEHVLQQMKTPVVYLNISKLTDYRKDAHPSIYRKIYKTAEEKRAAVSSQDCSHWCLPGVPDTWNELLYASLLKSGRGSWRN